MIHGHGDDIHIELRANFSSNVWYNADNKVLYEHLSTCLHRISRYPETDPGELKQLIGEQIAINPSQLLVCNGSTEAFYLIAQTFARKKSLIVSPTFSEYADACTMHQHSVYLKPGTNLAQEIAAIHPNLVWICNPNNPDGFCMKEVEILSLVQQFPTVIFIIDQAYIEFTTTEADVTEHINIYTNLIVIRSLTKRYAIPGLRLGYIVTNATTVAMIDKNRIPWSVNTLAIEAGKYLLQTKPSNYQLENWLLLSKTLQSDINKLGCFKTIPSETPYFLVKLKQGTARELKLFLLKEKILVRDATNFDELKGEMIRICALSEKQNELLIENLKRWMQFITA